MKDLIEPASSDALSALASAPVHGDVHTTAARAGLLADRGHGAVVDPLHLSATYTFADYETPRGYDYARSGGPNVDAFVRAVAALEGGCGGVATGSGMAALDLVLELLTPTDRVIMQADVYGGTRRLLELRARKGAFTFEVFDPRNLDALAASATGAAMIIAETPSNPLLRLVDLDRLGDIALAAGARLVVDNTFASPALQTPLRHGADIVVHSATKFINGHSDVVAGVVVTDDAALNAELAAWANAKGSTAAAFDAYLAARGLRTLPVRMARQQDTAQALAERLFADPRIAHVAYPGLASHPDHALAARQQRGPGAILTFQLAPGADVAAFYRALELFVFAESLGGVESLACHPWSMSHRCLPEADRAALGVTRDLVRVSVGLEGEEDLWSDLDTAIAVACAAS